MYFVFVTEMNKKNEKPSMVETGWLSDFHRKYLAVVFDEANSYPSFDEADKAAKAAGCLRYAILCLPTLNYCECREIGNSLEF